MEQTKNNSLPMSLHRFHDASSLILQGGSIQSNHFIDSGIKSFFEVNHDSYSKELVSAEEFWFDFCFLSEYLKETPTNTRIALVGENSYRLALYILAAFQAKKVLALINDGLQAEQMSTILNRFQPNLILVSGNQAEKVKGLNLVLDKSQYLVINYDEDKQSISTTAVIAAQLSKLPASQPLDGLDPRADLIVFSSGTTSTAKAIQLTWENVVHQVASFSERLACPQIVLTAAPWSHIYGLMSGLLTPIAQGATVLTKILPSLEPNSVKKWDLDARWMWRNASSSLVVTVPKVAKVMLDDYPPSVPIIDRDKHCFFLGGAPISHSLLNSLKQYNFGYRCGYGLTETTSAVCVCPDDCWEKLDGSIGLPLPGIEIKIDLDSQLTDGHGQILISGPTVMLGYLNDQKKTEQVLPGDGFLRTGDLGYFGAMGELYITGRCDRWIVLSNGKKVSPEELEEVFSVNMAETVNECFVGRFQGSDKLVLVVVPKAGTDNESELINQIREINQRLPKYSRIKYVSVRLQALPRNTAGKVLHSQVVIDEPVLSV